VLAKIKQIFFIMYKILFAISGWVLPKNQKLIIFESFLGKQYSDNPRAIYEYIQENLPEYKMYWSAERKSIHHFNDLDVQYVRRFSLKWIYLMNRAKYWITNSRLPLWIPKPTKTIYVQTWHGTPLKKLGVDIEEILMPGTNTEQYKRNFVTEAKKWNYLISPNSYSTAIFRRAFQFDKQIIQSGYPRNDLLVNQNNPDTIEKIKKTANLPDNKKIILYAPTWRDNEYYGVGRYKFDIKMDLKFMQEQLGEQYIVLLRLHYLIAENIDLSSYKGFIYDFSNYEDIRDLYLISDILVTDYSSVFFDYAILERPIIFYVYDIEDYRNKIRGFYFDFENQAPGPLVKTTEELVKEVKQIANGNVNSNLLSDFRKKYCQTEDGMASKKVVEEIFGN